MATLEATCWDEVFEWCIENEVDIEIIHPDDLPLRVFPFVRYESSKKRLVKMIEKFWGGNANVLAKIQLSHQSYDHD